MDSPLTLWVTRKTAASVMLRWWCAIASIFTSPKSSPDTVIHVIFIRIDTKINNTALITIF
jgi:hypothetical protein